jgi:hypothetical protein
MQRLKLHGIPDNMIGYREIILQKKWLVPDGIIPGNAGMVRLQTMKLPGE